ncbi:MAG: UDP-N-acetylmuramoyl-L-alanine--D-glutamate ligase [Proteobacteria bacterium]|nr:UDP-N-acetylmuramoyl-L-alanine--D-glutamate ligase [Pseudomonadota bacterium]
MKVTILGIARSGIAAAMASNRLGYETFLSDYGIPEKRFIDEIEKLRLPYETGKHSEKIFETDLIVVSPGIPSTVPVISEARKRGIRVISEIEFAFEHFKKPIIAVTGTNGKTTTATLIYNMLIASGLKALIGGNIAPGIPLSNFVSNDDDVNFIVAEISTFQLELIDKFNPMISVLTNISPDHIDRHKTMENYIKEKMKIFKNHKSNDYAVFNNEDINIRKYLFMIMGKQYRFSSRTEVSRGTFVKNGELIFRDGNEEKTICSVSNIKLPGLHNMENVLAASCSVLLAGGSIEGIRTAVHDTNSIPHRLEYLGQVKGVIFYNNSMCTNPVAFRRSLEALSSKNIVLIAGGREKDTGLGDMGKAIVEHVKYCVLIGELKERLEKELNRYGFKNYFKTNDFEEAVRTAFRHAKKGEIVMLSPGAASFDMFKSFEDRGDQFKKLFGLIKREYED